MVLNKIYFANSRWTQPSSQRLNVSETNTVKEADNPVEWQVSW